MRDLIGSAVYEHGKPLKKDDIIRRVPSIMAENPFGICSENYQYISTKEVLNRLWQEGYGVSYAIQSRSRIEGKQDFTKHMVRLRPRDSFGITNKSGFSEIVLINSHDRTSSYKLYAGYFRMVCSNGLVSGDVSSEIRIQHRGNIGDIIESAGKIAQQTTEIELIRDNMRSIGLNYTQRMNLAQEALKIKYDDESPIRPQQVLGYRRFEDRENSLWTVFNRIQENIMKGGLHGYNANGKRMTTRPIRSIDNVVNINRELWTLARNTMEQRG